MADKLGNMRRTHDCSVLRSQDIGREVVLTGWVQRRRDHGGVIFLDLRDHKGLVQVVVNPEAEAAFKIAEKVRSEYVIKAEGLVRYRPEGTINPDLPNGNMEVVASTLMLLNTADPLPFHPEEHHEISENVRLQYRFIDLRRSEMQSRLRFRAKLSHEIRVFLEKEGFVDSGRRLSFGRHWHDCNRFLLFLQPPPD